MSAHVEITGLDELRQFLTTAADQIREEGMQHVRTATEQTAAEVVRGLPSVTGVLRARVRTVYPSTSAAVGVVLSTAPHSHLVEFGSRLRRTRSGAIRGRMPAQPITPQRAEINRAHMFAQLVAMVRRFGFDVSD